MTGGMAVFPFRPHSLPDFVRLECVAIPCRMSFEDVNLPTSGVIEFSNSRRHRVGPIVQRLPPSVPL